MKRIHRLVALVSLVVAGAVALSGCVSLRYSNSIFDTGRTVGAGKTQAGVRGMVYPALLPASAYVKHAFSGGWQVTAGYGIHGIASTNGGASGSAIQGPELTVTKQVLKIGDLFYLAATGGADIDVSPQFGAMFYGGLDTSLYPTKWLSIYAQAKASYLLSGVPGVILAGGVGIETPLTAKVAAFYTPVVIGQTASNPQVFLPFGVMATVGYRF